MTRNNLAWTRNIGIMAHIDAGKTTVTENILFVSGRSHRIGSVDEGNTTTDHNPIEKKRGITIQSATVSTAWNWRGQSYQLNLIDTPGHMDFNGEVERSLRVLDGALALFCGVAGVEAQSRTVWDQANKFGLPRLAFVNKLDRPGADFERVVQQIRDVFGVHAVALQLPWFEGDRFCGLLDLVSEQALYWPEGATDPEVRPLPYALLPAFAQAKAQLLEDLAEADEQFLAAYLQDDNLASVESLLAALRRATLAGTLVPVLAGSAYRHIGVQPLLDAVAAFLPSPDMNREAQESAHFSGLVFKTLTDKFAGRVGFLRVFSGTLRPGDRVLAPRTGELERIARVFRLQGAQREELEEAHAGDIVAITGFRSMISGDTLCDPAHPVELEKIHFPDPVIDLAVELREKGLDNKLGLALNQLAAEDPALRYRTDAQSGQLILSGLGELHLEVVIDRLQEEYGLEVRTGRPAVAYKSTITRSHRHHERLKKQNGGSGQFAEMTIEVSPLEGGGFVFENAVVGGAIPSQFIPAIEKGIRRALQRGLFEDYPLEGVRVRLLDGGFHAKDSDAMAFEACAHTAMLEACKAAAPVVLEPVMALDLHVPSTSVGDAIADLNRRRARIMALEATGTSQAVKAEVPLSELFGYVVALRGLSSGAGRFTMQFSHFAQLQATAATPA
jgi:elongation factor G